MNLKPGEAGDLSEGLPPVSSLFGLCSISRSIIWLTFNPQNEKNDPMGIVLSQDAADTFEKKARPRATTLRRGS